jgi:uncharacterized protein (DUF697 family)
MPFGLGVGQVLGLVRDARGLEQARALMVGGPGAQAFATALALHGDGRAIAVDGDLADPAAVIRLLDGAPTTTDLALLRRFARAGVPLIAVQRGPAARVPYVLPHNVVDAAGGDVPVEQVARLLAGALPSADAAALAARLPVLRSRVERRIIQRTALTNAVIGGAPWVKEAHMPLLTLAQSRMLLELGAASGGAAPGGQQQVGRTAAPAIAASVGSGLTLRAVYRRLRRPGAAAGAAIAYVGTVVLGAARTRV